MHHHKHVPSPSQPGKIRTVPKQAAAAADPSGWPESLNSRNSQQQSSSKAIDYSQNSFRDVAATCSSSPGSSHSASPPSAGNLSGAHGVLAASDGAEDDSSNKSTSLGRPTAPAVRFADPIATVAPPAAAAPEWPRIQPPRPAPAKQPSDGMGVQFSDGASASWGGSRTQQPDDRGGPAPIISIAADARPAPPPAAPKCEVGHPDGPAAQPAAQPAAASAAARSSGGTAANICNVAGRGQATACVRHQPPAAALLAGPDASRADAQGAPVQSEQQPQAQTPSRPQSQPGRQPTELQHPQPETQPQPQPQPQPQEQGRGLQSNPQPQRQTCGKVHQLQESGKQGKPSSKAHAKPAGLAPLLMLCTAAALLAVLTAVSICGSSCPGALTAAQTRAQQQHGGTCQPAASGVDACGVSRAQQPPYRIAPAGAAAEQICPPRPEDSAASPCRPVCAVLSAIAQRLHQRARPAMQARQLPSSEEGLDTKDMACSHSLPRMLSLMFAEPRDAD